MTIVLPDGGAISKGDAEKLNDALGMMMEQSKLLMMECIWLIQKLNLLLLKK